MPDTTVVNWAEVADKALETGASAVAELSELVKSVAPEVWEIATRQAYVNVIFPFISDFTIFLVLGFIILRFKPRLLVAWEKDRDWPNSFAWIVGIVTTIFLMFSIYDASLIFKVSANPSYYAIAIIRDMI